MTETALEPKVQSTKILAADGSLITTLRQEENRENLPIEQIPRHVRDAVIAVEDSRFYTHKGVDAKAILRALYSNASTGRIVEGGSTITQQLVRNAVTEVGREKTLERKIKEASYAYNVDKGFTKDKILELYLNTVYFGAGAYGVQTAAQTFFAKDAKDLTLAEGALLAGLIKSPVNYDPRINPDAALRRRNLVLDRMFINELAATDAIVDAKSQELALAPKAESSRYLAPYFVDYVTRQIQRSDDFKDLGQTEIERGNTLFRGGLRIHTTLMPKIQAAAETAITKVLDNPDADPVASLVAIDPKDGHIKALVGGRDYFASPAEDVCVRVGAKNADGSAKTCAKVNLALGQGGGGSGRQSGSAFKPFVLATALQQGKRLTDRYQASACTEIPNADAGGTQPWRVCNYEDAAFGSTSIEEATYKSINTVYAQMIMDVGPKAAVETAEKMGICETTRPLLPEGRKCELEAVPSAALGANAVSTLDMTSAFTAFPNGGVHHKAVSITKITDAAGHILWRPVPEKRQVLNPGIAYLATTALQSVITKGTASRSGKIGRPAFGKTGTAQEWRDAWFIGGAGTDLVAGVAVFWPDGEIEMKPSCDGRRTGYSFVQNQAGQQIALGPECRKTRIRVTGGSWPTQIWQLFMLSALDGVPASSFPVPEVEIVKVAVDISRGCLPNPYTPAALIETQSFIKGTEPADICKEPTGPVSSILPNVVGYPQDQAKKLLEQAGFQVKLLQEPSGLYPPGRVIRQQPSASSDVAPGSVVTLYISVAAEDKLVPDVINRTENDAKAILQQAGFTVAFDRAESCKGKASTCIVKDQDPDGNTKAPAGSEVRLTIGPGG
ncbi:MAG: transglycosylase domain-containing protein [Actinomycetota bacterium]